MTFTKVNNCSVWGHKRIVKKRINTNKGTKIMNLQTDYKERYFSTRLLLLHKWCVSVIGY